MTASTVHFRVGNGDMTLIEFEDGRAILADVNARQPGADIPDVIAQLRKRLKRDASGRLYLDAFLLTHPDQDHCRGLREHFHLGPPETWSKTADRIVIREMWSSPIVFRRASRDHKLCEDADAWACEARRRVKRFRAFGIGPDGERIRIMGEDVDGKTDDLGPILVKVDEEFSTICGATGRFKARLIAPMPASDDEEDEILSKNNSSVILGLAIQADGFADASRYLFGGDAEVGIWERVWDRNKGRKHVLEYDVLIAPHHCSWRSLSWYSWSDYGQDAEVSDAARAALGQARSGAEIIASSKKVKDDHDDPPCIRAKREYEDIVEPQKGTFTCVADRSGSDPYVIEVTHAGHKPKRPTVSATVAASTGIGATPLPHG
ncbi:metallohydrolase [Methylorubrum extorquens]|uniref:metallohydrolase n=1 Tax=Methylorubrum extorquens TaxID=408 RepID=UPI002237A649|nr:metallohydrolase [Methylorubrum extorquens]UYW28314.1 metallohydrolase [Methylorubrum extorquens]